MSEPVTKPKTELEKSDGFAFVATDPAFWFELIDEKEAAKYLNFSIRHMQGMRYRGGGPKFVRVSSRCVKYRRWDCRKWSEALLVSSTSDPGGKR